MRIDRERHLDDASRHLVSIALQTRSHDAHSLLSDAPERVREQIGEVLVRALDEIHGVLKPLLDEPRSPA